MIVSVNVWDERLNESEQSRTSLHDRHLYVPDQPHSAPKDVVQMRQVRKQVCQHREKGRETTSNQKTDNWETGTECSMVPNIYLDQGKACRTRADRGGKLCKTRYLAKQSLECLQTLTCSWARSCAGGPFGLRSCTNAAATSARRNGPSSCIRALSCSSTAVLKSACSWPVWGGINNRTDRVQSWC